MCGCLGKGERISFSPLLSPSERHQWSVKGKMERTTVNFLTSLKRLGKRPCELEAYIFLGTLKISLLSKSFNIPIGFAEEEEPMTRSDSWEKLS